jgi:ADP-ribose pyrophosphatase YjhB (NUDIX family)
MIALRAAVESLILRPDKTLLCVWLQRYGGWTLPGGLVEPKESSLQALRRTLEWQTALKTAEASLVYLAPRLPARRPILGVALHVYRVKPYGVEPRATRRLEVRWMTFDEFLRVAAFADFYERMRASSVDVSTPSITRSQLVKAKAFARTQEPPSQGGLLP